MPHQILSKMNNLKKTAQCQAQRTNFEKKKKIPPPSQITSSRPHVNVEFKAHYSMPIALQ